VRRLIVPALAGIGAALLILAIVAGTGQFFGQAPGIPWSCGDTRFVDTVPTGRAVVGAAVSAPPGCGK
jgi:hypothetical protein